MSIDKVAQPFICCWGLAVPGSWYRHLGSYPWYIPYPLDIFLGGYPWYAPHPRCLRLQGSRVLESPKIRPPPKLVFGDLWTMPNFVFWELLISGTFFLVTSGIYTIKVKANHPKTHNTKITKNPNPKQNNKQNPNAKFGI